MYYYDNKTNAIILLKDLQNEEVFKKYLMSYMCKTIETIEEKRYFDTIQQIYHLKSELHKFFLDNKKDFEEFETVDDYINHYLNEELIEVKENEK